MNALKRKETARSKVLASGDIVLAAQKTIQICVETLKEAAAMGSAPKRARRKAGLQHADDILSLAHDSLQRLIMQAANSGLGREAHDLKTLAMFVATARGYARAMHRQEPVNDLTGARAAIEACSKHVTLGAEALWETGC